MRCETASEWMSLHLDGQLAPAQVALLVIHLSKCETCRQEWAALQRVEATLSAAPAVVPQPGFVNHVMQRLGQEPDIGKYCK